MTLPSLSVVMTVTNRPVILWRSLLAWSLTDYPDVDFTIVDNGSGNKEIGQIISDFADRMYARGVTVRKVTENECIATNVLWNREGKASRGEYVVFSMMDEIVSHPTVLQSMVETTDQGDCRATLAVAFLDKNTTDTLAASKDWQAHPFTIPAPWGTVNGAPDMPTMGHITGNYRKNWEWFGWYRDHKHGHLWVEQDIHIREKCLNKLARSPSQAWCYHQYHTSSVDPGSTRPGYHYVNDAQARLLEPAERDKA